MLESDAAKEILQRKQKPERMGVLLSGYEPGQAVRSPRGGHVYVTMADGSSRREIPKVRGKAARKADKRRRREARAAVAAV